jgi:hypothetical protein
MSKAWIEIHRVVERHWFWQPYYIEAKAYGYVSYHKRKWWQPYVYYIVGFRYFVNGVEWDLLKNTECKTPKPLKRGQYLKFSNKLFVDLIKMHNFYKRNAEALNVRTTT